MLEIESSTHFRIRMDFSVFSFYGKHFESTKRTFIFVYLCRNFTILKIKVMKTHCENLVFFH